jgi:hypothetical protein
MLAHSAEIFGGSIFPTIFHSKESRAVTAYDTILAFVAVKINACLLFRDPGHGPTPAIREASGFC